MNQREKLLIGVIAGLALVLAVGFGTNFANNNTIPKTQTTKSATPVVDELTPAPQPKLQYAALSDDQNQKSPLTVLFKNVENSVVQITSKVSTTNNNIIINGSPLESESSRLGSGFVYDT